MTWAQRYKLQTFLASSIWPAPVAAIIICLAVVLPFLRWLDHITGWTLPAQIEGARGVVGTLTAGLLSFIVFVFSTLLLTVQVAGSQLTPRVVYRVFADRVTKSALVVFVSVFTIALGTLARLKSPVPMISGVVSTYGSAVALAVFIFLIDWVGGQLRLSKALLHVSGDGQRVIRGMYPQPYDTDKGDVEPDAQLNASAESITHTGRYGILQAFDASGIVHAAASANVICELVPQTGRFVAQGDVLFRIQGKVTADLEATLRHSVVFGSERTLTQDPAFALRIIVDIACKALSPAVNDPTTAVLAIDQIQYLLRILGKSDLESALAKDEQGNVRLIYHTPEWEDYVLLAVTEIRHFGADSVQVTRRLKAMLDELIEVLPAPRRRLLRQERAVLNRQIKRIYEDPTDQARAATSDAQGVGGSEAE